MDSNPSTEKIAMFLAEEVLRTIYGDDYKGCNITPATVAATIQEGLNRVAVQHQDLFSLYEKVVEAIHLLSTPPDVSKVTDANELRNLLGQRLDGIHAITTKTMKTTALVRGKPQDAG